jgi:hypothetical protein
VALYSCSSFSRHSRHEDFYCHNGKAVATNIEVMAPVEVTDDYYAILEVPFTATIDDIKQSYRRLAILLHPDKNQDKPDATASFQLASLLNVSPRAKTNLFPQLNRAYETLKDEYSRRIYDLRWPSISPNYHCAPDRAKRGAAASKVNAGMTDAERERAAREDAAVELAAREEALIRNTRAMFDYMFAE